MSLVISKPTGGKLAVKKPTGSGWTIKGNGTGQNLLYSQAGTPALDLRFADTKSLNDYVSGTNRITFARASTATYVGANGLIQTAASNEARFDHNPTTGESLGLLVEEARTNLLLNSATLSTQSATVTAVANTLSFYGTGTVTLTGVSTAGPLVGTGANNRVSLTFTPTAGSLTLTVSGSVTNAQLEAGAFPTSYIPTTSATATRAADVVSITGANFSSWYNQTEGTMFAITKGAAKDYVIARNSDGSNLIALDVINTATVLRGVIYVAGSATLNINTGSFSLVAGNTLKSSMAYQLNNAAIAANSSLLATGSPSSFPTLSDICIGNLSGTAQVNGTISRFVYWPTRLSNTTLQQITQ